MTTKQRKMTNIEIAETSGVDHPAHLSEGWVLMKSASTDQIEGLFGSPTTGGSTVAKEEEGAVETVAKSALDAAEAEIAELKEKLEKAAAPKEDEQEDILKGVPEAVRKQLDEQAAQITKAREDFEKERAARLDDQAISKSRTIFKSLAFDHEKVAPALRRIEESDPELFAQLDTVMRAAEGQLESAGIFQELGAGSGVSGDGSAVAVIEGQAAELVKSGVVKTREQGITKALQDNPQLFNDYRKEAGK